ncbi:MAG TPA: SDR family NAD(P)-dependent oxidoreductase [Acidimicrobiales bacterium]|nr:SDR family NAD(P)-dependent oxidoreductase [Acidimicrobiales bacterium]
MGSQKVAFVTGASRGIGRAIALDLAQHGFHVAAAARSVDHSVVDWAGTVEETCESVREFGRRGLPVELDLTQPDDVRRAVASVMDEFGRIDVLVTSATNIDFSPDGTYLNEFVATSWEALERHIQVNITSSMLLLHLVLPVMYAQHSGIVMSVTQASAWLDFPDLPMPGQGICGMAIPVTRGVTDRLAPALRREVAPHGVTVLTFDPGMTISNAPERYRDTLKAGYLPEMAHSVVVPARAATYIATCPDPSVYNGAFVSALDLVRDHKLLTEAEILPDWRLGVQEVTSVAPLSAT